MFFPWLFIFSLASYGLSGVESNHHLAHGNNYNAEADTHGARFLDASDDYLRSELVEENLGQEAVIEGSLNSVVNLMSALVDATKTTKRSGSWNLRSSGVSEELQKKLQQTQHYASLLQKLTGGQSTRYEPSYNYN